jgi:hypothetical protein
LTVRMCCVQPDGCALHAGWLKQAPIPQRPYRAGQGGCSLPAPGGRS